MEHTPFGRLRGLESGRAELSTKARLPGKVEDGCKASKQNSRRDQIFEIRPSVVPERKQRVRSMSADKNVNLALEANVSANASVSVCIYGPSFLT